MQTPQLKSQIPQVESVNCLVGSLSWAQKSERSDIKFAQLSVLTRSLHGGGLGGGGDGLGGGGNGDGGDGLGGGGDGEGGDGLGGGGVGGGDGGTGQAVWQT